MSIGAIPWIRIQGLRQSFGKHEILRGVDLDIFRGETLAIIGTSGGGKSVLIKHIPGLLRATGGTVTVDGIEISNLKERELGPIRKQMGFMFQGGALFDSLTVEENIAFPLRESGLKNEKEIAARVAETLEIVSLPGEQNTMPADLSGGMRKRVALARAVVHKPHCVLYDEPLSGLDPATGRSIDLLIKDLQIHYGITNIVITHELQSVFSIADRVAFIEQGRVYWTGTPAELRKTQDALLKNFIQSSDTREIG